MDGVIIDNLVIAFALIYYIFLMVIYFLRARELSKLEIKLGPIFSILLIPFILLWTVNLVIDNNSGRLFAGLPIILYLSYDLWYRQISKKKPVHHPKRWPKKLIIYLILLMIGSIGLNWYGYIVSDLMGTILVMSFFVMMSFFGYYRYSQNKKNK